MSAESISKAAEIYENMLKNPENRKRSYMKQPMPGDGELDGAKSPAPASDPDIDEDWIKEVDRRVANKNSGISTPVKETKVAPAADNKRVAKLEEEVKELKELMSIIMKQHLKLMESKNG